MVISVNTLNFDNLIYNNPPKESTGVVHEYLETLSTDSENLAAIYSHSQEMAQEKNEQNSDEYYYSRINQKVLELKEKYDDPRFDWRTFNWSEYKAYKTLENVEVIDKKTR